MFPTKESEGFLKLLNVKHIGNVNRHARIEIFYVNKHELFELY